MTPRKLQQTPISHTPGNPLIPNYERIPGLQPIGKGFFGVCSSSVCAPSQLTFSHRKIVGWKMIPSPDLFSVGELLVLGSATSLTFSAQKWLHLPKSRVLDRFTVV